MNSVDEAWRTLSFHPPALLSLEERLNVWCALWPQFQNTTPIKAWARIHPEARAEATVWLCELGSVWSAAHRFPERAERDAEIFLWETTHAGSRRALSEWTRANWRDPFFQHPTHRFADLLRRANRFDGEALPFLREAFGGEEPLPTSTDGAGGSNDATLLLKRAVASAKAQSPELERSWRLREQLQRVSVKLHL